MKVSGLYIAQVKKKCRFDVGLNKTEKKFVCLLIKDSEYTSDELAAEIGVTKRT